MSTPFYAMLSRLRYITRWGLMRNTRPENVMEHTAVVAMFAHALAVLHNERGGNVSPDRVGMMALFHETGEVITGDMPTPVKYFNAQIRGEYAKLEDRAVEKIAATLPDPDRKGLSPFLQPDRVSQEYRFMKAADKLSAYLKCLEERQAGNREFDEAGRAAEEKLRAMGLKEVDWFLSHFAGSFALTLDELNRKN